MVWQQVPFPRSLTLIFGIAGLLPSLPKEPAGASIHIMEVFCFVFVFLSFVCFFILAVLVFRCCAWASHGGGVSRVLGHQ